MMFTTSAPNHFLKPTPHESIESEYNVPVSNTEAERLAEFHRHTVETLRQFWDIWTTAYLQSLRNRPAAMNFQRTNRIIHRSPEVGDVVLVKDDIKKKRTWKTAKITKINISEDGKVRSAEIQVGSRK